MATRDLATHAFLLLACCAAPAGARADFVDFFEDFDDGAHDLELWGGMEHTVGSGSASQSYTIEPDGAGSDFELRLDLLSPASDDGNAIGSYAWPAARTQVPERSNASFVVSAEFEVDEAIAEGPNRSLSVGVVARCSYLYNADNCVSFDAMLTSRYYRLSWAIVGEGAFPDVDAPPTTGMLRLVEHAGDGQVDSSVAGLVVPLGTPFTLSLEGTVVGDTLVLVGRMRSGLDEVEVQAVDPTPLLGPGFGVRTGGAVSGFGGADAIGVLDVDVDDLRVAPEPEGAAAAGLALGCLLWRRSRGARQAR